MKQAEISYILLVIKQLIETFHLHL